MKTRKILSWAGTGLLLLLALVLFPSLASAALALAGVLLLPLSRWQVFLKERLKLAGKGKAIGIAALFLLGVVLTPTAQPKPSEPGLDSLAAEPAVYTSDFQAETNETVTFRRAELQIPASWSERVLDDTLYVSPDGAVPDRLEEAQVITVRPVSLEIPEGGLAESDFQDAAADTFFSTYRGGGKYLDFTVIQKEYVAAQDGSPDLLLCAFEAVRDDVRVSRSAGFFIAGGELYVLEVPWSENDRYNYTGDVDCILRSVTAAPEPGPETSPEPSAELSPEASAEPSSEPTSEPTPGSDPEPAPEPEETAEPVSEPAPEPVEADYVLNTNSKKFHIPSCSSVKQMKESNKQLYTGTRDQLIAAGYSPCGNCRP